MKLWQMLTIIFFIFFLLGVISAAWKENVKLRKMLVECREESYQAQEKITNKLEE